MNDYYNRIDKIENIDILCDLISKEYQLGTYKDSFLIETGYEDFNVKLVTSSGKYLIKIFRNSRSYDEAKECIERNFVAYENKIRTPKVFKNSKGEILTTIEYNMSKFRLAVIDYIDGQTFFELNRKPSIDELKKIVDIGCSLNILNYKPKFIYDTWAITSFCDEYEKKESIISLEYLEILTPIYKRFKQFNYDDLPKSFVHGDLRSTNLILDHNGEVWAVDFSVSNYTARLNEIVVICTEIAIIPDNKNESKFRIDLAFKKWCKEVKATKLEKDSFYLLYDVANAINVLNAAYELANGNDSDETKMYLNAGLFALEIVK